MSLNRGRSMVMARIGLMAMALSMVCSMSVSQAQNQDEMPPDPEQLTLETKDGVQIGATWYAGTKKKESIPIIMLHDWDGSRAQYSALASYLQSMGHSVIVPDLRGHGDSVRVRGTDMTLDREKFNRATIASMGEDIEACKRFLMKKNNEGALNIEMLSLVAAGQSSVLAALWAVKDWEWPAVGGRKQGQGRQSAGAALTREIHQRLDA